METPENNTGSDTVKIWFPALADEKLLKRLLEAGQWHSFKAGDVLIRPGQPIPFLPLITAGTIRIVRDDEEGREIFLYFINAGESCAFSLDYSQGEVQSRVKAVAEEDGVLLAIPVGHIRSLRENFAAFSEFTTETYRRGFDRLLGALEGVAFDNLDNRLRKYLLDLSIARNNNTLNITHDDISRQLGTTREVISRILKQLERTGEIRLGRGLVERIS